MAEWVLIGILVTLILWQQVQIQKLLNKLMSRDYSDYAQGERLKKPPTAPKIPAKAATFDPIAERNAREANNLLL